MDKKAAEMFNKLQRTPEIIFEFHHSVHTFHSCDPSKLQ